MWPNQRYEFGDQLSVTDTKGKKKKKNSIVKLSVVVVNLVLGKNSFVLFLI